MLLAMAEFVTSGRVTSSPFYVVSCRPLHSCWSFNNANPFTPFGYCYDLRLSFRWVCGREQGSNKKLIEQLRSKITTVEAELAKLQEQNAEYRKQVAELTDQLKKTDAQLDAMARTKGGANPILVRENRVLRDIIDKQLKSQSRRMQAKQLVVAELAKPRDGLQGGARPYRPHGGRPAAH